MADLQHLIPQLDRARGTWTTAASRLQEIAELMLPYGSNITMFGGGQGMSRNSKTSRLFHSAGVVAPDKLARSMYSAVTPPAFEWHSPVMRQEHLNQTRSIRAWLQSCSKRLFAVRRQSNFQMEIGRFYHSFCALGTAGIYVDEKTPSRPGEFGGFRYSFMPLGTHYIQQNGDSLIDTLFRVLRMPIRSAVEQFGYDSAGYARLSAGVPDLSGKLVKTPDEELEIIHAVYPRSGRDPRRENSRTMPIASCYFLEKGPAGGHVLRESGYREQPFVVARWDVAQREVWGTGPGHLAYPDVASLNALRRARLSGTALAVEPPMIARRKILMTEVALAARAVMYAREGYPGEKPVEPLDLGQRFDVAKITEQDLIQALDDMYYLVELILPEGGPQMTATETERRVQQKQELLGPTMGRLEAELLNPLFHREFALGMRGGLFDPPPPELIEAAQRAAQRGDRVDIDVQWEGPLARAQRGYELVAIDRQMEGTFRVAAVQPEVLDLYDFDEQERRRAEITGYPADVMRDPKKVAQIRAARAEAQQAEKQAAGLAGIAESIGKAGPGIKALHETTQGVTT